MERNYLLEICRYYKGEESSPFDGEDNNKSMLWFYERAWVANSLRGASFEEQIKDYAISGLLSFCKSDNIPTSYKALLFNRYSKGNQSMAESVPDFKAFYKKYYS